MDENNTMSNYISKLEHLLLQSVKSQTNYRNKIKNKLKK